MKQILQNLKTGTTEVAEVPCPALSRGQVLIRTSRTLVSAGTERMLLDFGKAGWINKARQQPDKVKMVLQKARTDGLAPTVEAVFNKLDQPLALGYCNVGRILEVGSGVSGLEPGMRVVSNGKHAEVVSVGANLCAQVPPAVTDDEAAFTVLAAIGLQGIRLAEPTLGETFVVTGLGLIGLITVQILRAHGCRVLGIDFDPTRLELARKFGADVVNLGAGEDPLAAAQTFSRGRGVDGVLITASTRSNEPVHQAALMCRKRGRIVLVGVTGLELSRADFYEKELTFQVSCSYGPGRYDVNYEEKGLDYPIGFVRWTEQRNFEAVLDLMAEGRLDVKPLISHRFPVGRAEEAYEIIGDAGSSLGVILEYPPEAEQAETELRRATIILPKREVSGIEASRGAPSIALIGSGSYATAVLIPAFKKAGARLTTVASSSGVTGLHAGKKFGFAETTTNTDGIFSDDRIDTVVISTRHNTHAALAARGMRAGKHVFVEKPLALTHDELDDIELARTASTTSQKGPLLMVGFNRRFSPHLQQVHKLLVGVHEPKAIVITVNAGAIPPDHWTQDPAVGGGRIIGEACHFIDAARFIAQSPITGWDVSSMNTGGRSTPDDRVSMTLRFEDGSFATILYLANGHKSFPKERFEVFAGGRILQLDNFKTLTGYGWPRFSRMRLMRQDKGQAACVAAFVTAIERGADSPIPHEEIMEVSRVTIDIAEAVR